MNPEAKIMLDHCASLGITHGRMLDLGAGNDVEGDSSVALPFIERGWDVVLVDAAPACVEILAAKYGRHPKVKVVQALVASYQVKFAPFYQITTDVVLSTACEALMKRRIGREEFSVIHQAVVTVNDLVDKFGPFDVVSVDIEGHSMAAARQFMRCPKPPYTICVEVFPKDVLGQDEAAEMNAFAEWKEVGYAEWNVVARTKENLVLVCA